MTVANLVEYSCVSSFKKVKKMIKDPVTTLDDIKKEYLDWVQFDEFLIFQHQRHHEKRRFIASLCPKRGNQKYAYRTRDKFRELYVPFEREKEQSESVNETETNVLFLTLTYDTNLRDFKSAWSRPYEPKFKRKRTILKEQIMGIKKQYKTGISEEWNRFLSNLRRKYGRILTVRCFESSEKGYPHVHAVVYMEEQCFPTFLKWSDKEQNYKWRIPFEDAENIKQYWHSWVDVQGMPFLVDGFKYLGKYISKGSDLSQKAVTTLGCTWAWHKRAYSIGKKFKEEIFKRYLNLDLTPNSLFQTISSQMTLNYEELKNTVPSFLRLAPEHPKKGRRRLEIWYDWRSQVHEKYVVMGVKSKKTLKLHGGVPKNLWSYGMNEQQTNYLNFDYYS